MWVSNAKQAAAYYTSKLGFEYKAYKGLETNSRDWVSHAVGNGKIVFVLTSPLNPGEQEFGKHLMEHGDGVRDVSFQVNDCKAIYEKAITRGAKSVKEPEELKDENGTVIFASIMTYGDTVHSLIQYIDYNGPFLPGYKVHPHKEIMNTLIEPPVFDALDHVVGNQPDLEMEPTAKWYEKMLDFHRYWSIDDS